MSGRKRIYFRADGSAQIGLGHLIRSLSLAQMLKNDFEIIYAIQEPSKEIEIIIQGVTKNIVILPKTSDYSQDCSNFLSHIKEDSIVVIDGYSFDSSYQKKLKLSKSHIVYIDDFAEGGYNVDTIINHAPGVNKTDYNVGQKVKTLLGLDYVLLRPVFLNTKKRSIGTKIENVFINFGGADIENNTLKTLEICNNTGLFNELHVVLGAVNRHQDEVDNLIKKSSSKVILHKNLNEEEFLNVLNKCQLAICPASTVLMEVCAVGMAAVSGFTVDNQKNILNGMDSLGAVLNIGDFNTISPEAMKTAIINLYNDPDLIKGMVERQNKLIDGRSKDRLLKYFKEI